MLAQFSIKTRFYIRYLLEQEMFTYQQMEITTFRHS